MKSDPQRTYTPYGGARAMWTCKQQEILYDGPAGTGKTRAVLEKAHLIAMKYAGARILLVRKTRTSLSESVLQIFEQHVLPENSPLARGAKRSHRASYSYPNGSMIICGGLDNADRIMSTEFDMAFCFEATEATEDDWEKLLTRLRNHVVPYQQAIADCNPSYPGHWLKVRADADKMKRIQSRHEDNPSVTSDYLETLNKLSGHRRNRLYLGNWCAAEGLIYDHWQESKFVQKKDQKFDRYIIGVDEGYTNPCAMHLYGVDNDGRVHVMQEWYERNQLESAVVDHATCLQTEYDVEAVVVDPSAAKLIAAMIDGGLPVVAANNDVFGGIQECQKMLDIPGDGIPRLTVDPSCHNWIEEISSYQWHENRDGSRQDKPKKENDHAMDNWRYVQMYLYEHSGSMEVMVI